MSKKKVILGIIIAVISLIIGSILISNISGNINKMEEERKQMTDETTMTMEIRDMVEEKVAVTLIFENPIGINEITYPNNKMTLYCYGKKRVALDYMVDSNTNDTFIITSMLGAKTEKTVSFAGFELEAKFDFVTPQSAVQKVEVGIITNETAKLDFFAVQYNLEEGNNDSSLWKDYSEGAKFDVIKNGYIYGRIINKNTKDVLYTFSSEITKIDREAPDYATIVFNSNPISISAELRATVTHKDIGEAGINIRACKWMWSDSNRAVGTNPDAYNGGYYPGTFSSNGETVKVSGDKIPGTYYLHVLTIDNAGNATETISDPLVVKGAIYLNTQSFGNTSYMPGWTMVNSQATNRLAYTTSKGDCYVISNTAYNLSDIDSITFSGQWGLEEVWDGTSRCA